jgi:8-oxo-dGTP pyrophosphatase MutT (NUDIX family)
MAHRLGHFTKTARVALASIQSKSRILAKQRGYGELAGAREFPAGNQEGESSLEACRREVREELDITIGDEDSS